MSLCEGYPVQLYTECNVCNALDAASYALEIIRKSVDSLCRNGTNMPIVHSSVSLLNDTS